MRVRKLNRLMGYDYSRDGMYFITVCACDGQEIFGEIENKKCVGTGLAPVRIKYSELGKIIEKNWQAIKILYENVELDEFIIMPNHMHGIIIKRTGTSPVPTISQIVGSFKSRTAMEYFKKGSVAGKKQKIWQRSYHDRIIRCETELNNIRKYIRHNPINWPKDELNIVGDGSKPSR